MRLLSTIISSRGILFLILLYLSLGTTVSAQQTTIREYVLFGGNGLCPACPGQKQPLAPGCGVQVGSFSKISGGSVGSYRLVKSTGSATIKANIYCGGTIHLANGNKITGNITAANSHALRRTILSTGSYTSIEGNINVNGNIFIGSGTVAGKITHPPGTTYTGPLPVGGNITGAPMLPQLPQMPSITDFPASTNMPDINSTRSITPGTYDDIKLPGNKTLTFSGTGVYVFDKIDNRGGPNFFVFDFKNSPAGTFKIYVHNDVDLGKVIVSMINGGSASRIFTEIHGNGTSSSNGTWCFNMANCSPHSSVTKWQGTVWAPYAGINIGSGTGNSIITGALWSGTQVNVQCGTKIIYAPYTECITPDANAGPDKPLDFEHPITLNGSSTTPGVSFNWQAINGGLITSPANAQEITVSVAGTYILTVTSATNCTAKDTAIVTGKTKNLIGSELQSVVQNFNPNDPPSSFFILQHDSIMIDVIAKEDKYAATLSLLTSPAFGLANIISNGSSNFIITGLFQISKLPLLNSLDSLVVYCRPFYGAFNNGLVVSAGDTAVRSNLVRNGYNLQGEGVKVGVISDSYNSILAATTNPITNTAAQDVGNDDLPGAGNLNGNITPVHVLKDYLRGSDEGRAMLQIVHDLAPKAELYFRTGFLSAGDFAIGIDELNQAGCNIIVDDVTFITEPFLKDGVVANAVDSVTKKGTTYFSAAGNFGNQSYENTFNPVAAPAGLAGSAHNFGEGDIYQSVTLSPGNYVIVLQWLDDIYSLGQTSSGGTKNDLDIYLTPNTDGTALFGFNRNNTHGDPIEILPFAVTSQVQTNILITNNTPGSNPARFKYVVFRGNIKFNEYASGTSTLVGQANAAGSIAVGAASYAIAPPFPGPLIVEPFSSTGGTFINNIQRNKPELIAPDGVNTTVNLGEDYDHNNYANFFGTSAAAPHAAGVAALIMEGKKKFLNQPLTSPGEIRALLQNTANDMGTPGFDFTSGYGFINADSAMRTFAKPDPTLDTLVFPSSVVPGKSSFTLTVRGTNLSYNSIINFRGVPLETKVLNPGEATAEIPAFTGNPAISVYTPPFSLSNRDGGSSDSMYFFKGAKKKIIVTADIITKKFAQQLPSLTATVLVDSVLLQNTALTLADLGLDSIIFTTLATTNSDIGTYLIIPSRISDPSNPADAGFSELYDYKFNTGSVIIEKLPVTVTAKSSTITYGQKIPDIQFTYQFDGTNIPDSVGFLNTIQSAHQSQLAKDAAGNDVLGLVNGKAVTILNGKAVTILNGKSVTILNGKAVTILNGQEVPVVNAQALTIVNGIVTDTSGIVLTAAQVENLSFLTTIPSLQNARELTNQTFINGSYITGTTRVVDITQESILSFNENAAQTYMLSSVSDVDAKGLVDNESFVNGKAVTILNGKAVTILNGKAVTILNGKAVTILNGKAVTILNGDTIPIVSSQNKTAVIVDSSEIGVEPPSQLKSINMITGLDAGDQFIIPGSLVNPNLQITHKAGVVNILPAPVIITPTAGLHKVYGTEDPAFTFTNNAGLSANDFKGAPGRLSGSDVGDYEFTIGNLSAGANYILTISTAAPVSTFAITPKSVTITPTPGQTKIYGNPDPVFTFTNNAGLTANSFTGALGRVSGSNAGKYAFTIGNLSAGNNYSLTLACTSTFTISKAPLQVDADDKVIFKYDALPCFTSTITGLKNGDNPTVSYTLSPACTGNAGVYTIIPMLKYFANLPNYRISYSPGKLYVNPKGQGAKKLTPYLDCVEELSAGRYIAHFYCINDNATPVYVIAGIDNSLSSAGSFDNSTQPFIFMPGTTRYNVPFDGNTLKWELRTYECYAKTITSASACATSARCNLYTSARSVSPNMTVAIVKDPVKTSVTALIPGNNINVYPNPAKDRAAIYLTNGEINVKGLSLFDARGRLLPLKIIGQASKNTIEIDLSQVISGMYFIRVKAEDGYKTICIVKE
ncbi:MAG: MBG domain-containing protein [Ferruginibacter sp.]